VYQTPDPSDTLDNSAPQINISFGQSGPGSFRNGDFVSNPVHMTCAVFDSTVIDTASLYLLLSHLTDDQGHPMTDSVAWSWWPNTPYPPGFSSTSPDSQHFVLTYADSLAPGEWEFIMRISDLFNNGPAGSTITFNVAGVALDLENVLNYPNPFQDQTDFTFTLSGDALVTIKIYSVAGRLLRTLNATGSAGFNTVDWDGCDGQGDALSNGVYLYKIIAASGDKQKEKIGKLAKLR
jgi:hypothetical protein